MLNGQKVEITLNDGFDAVPSDKYTVQIVDVNLKTQPKFQSVEEEQVLEYKFQILDENPMTDSDETTRGRFLWRKCRLALNSRSHLGKLAAAVYGRELTKEEAENFDPESIVGEQINVMVDETPSKKDPNVIFNNIISFSKVVKKLKPLPIEKKEKQVVEKTTKSVVAATAPDAEAEEFVSDLEQESPAKPESQEAEEEEENPEVLELQLKLAKAKAALAKAAKK